MRSDCQRHVCGSTKSIRRAVFSRPNQNIKFAVCTESTIWSKLLLLPRLLLSNLYCPNLKPPSGRYSCLTRIHCASKLNLTFSINISQQSAFSRARFLVSRWHSLSRILLRSKGTNIHLTNSRAILQDILKCKAIFSLQQNIYPLDHVFVAIIDAVRSSSADLAGQYFTVLVGLRQSLDTCIPHTIALCEIAISTSAFLVAHLATTASVDIST